MADLLTHVLAVYVLLTAAGWRFERVTRSWVVVGMGGAAIPDLVKIGILLDPRTVEAALGVPFGYRPLSTLGGVALVAGVVALLFGRCHRWRAYGALLAGGVTSLLLDGCRVFVTGRAGPYFYPLTWWRPPSPNLYVTADPRVLGVALATALVVFLADRRRSDPGEGRRTATTDGAVDRPDQGDTD